MTPPALDSSHAQQLIAELQQALTATNAALLANDGEQLAAASQRQEDLLARLAPLAESLRADASLLAQVQDAALLNEQVAALLAARQSLTRTRLEALGVRPVAATYSQFSPRSAGRRLGSA
ncbi:MAG: hypothetical protein RR758_03575 [Burkholderiaceae bacterium]